MRGVRHHLLDVVSPERTFTAHEFVIHTTYAIAQIKCKGKIPIICGGTGFYIDALLGRITLPNVPANTKLRTNLEKKTSGQLLALLKGLDARRAKTIDPHNKRRLIRALEIAAYTDQPSNISGLRNHYMPLWIGIAPERAELRRRINKRLKERLKRGMIVEARRLHARGLSYRRMAELGLEYRSLARFLQGDISRSGLEQKLQSAIWQYAKRQMTYWKRNTDIQWFSTTSRSQIEKNIQAWLRK